MLTYATLIQSLSTQVILPLYYHDDASVCVSRLHNLYKAGIRVIEFTNRGPQALMNFKAMKQVQQKEYPDLKLAVGTIYTEADALSFSDAGADLLISPVFVAEVAAFCAARHLPYIPGCMTPTEIFSATQGGCTLIKLFPAHVVGASYIKSIQELFPGTHFMPTGGIKPDIGNLQEWLTAGAIAVGVGSPLFNSFSSDAALADRIREIIALRA
jgi:2-dehydro-3-deoxyphosphogluconate aldolase/(4S)-4-hydroxy-2-oxoglutarate aldolase